MLIKQVGQDQLQVCRVKVSLVRLLHSCSPLPLEMIFVRELLR